MKTITALEHDLILDVRNEGLSALPPGIFEKDLLITEVLGIIQAVDSSDIRLVFCGGTCIADNCPANPLTSGCGSAHSNHRVPCGMHWS
jgi:hypothetical protein